MDSLTLIKSPVLAELEQFRALFHDSLNSNNELLNSALDHIMKKNGKMMRPILVFLAARLVGAVNDEALHAAASLEFLHTASLVHDDIVDESTERRGQLSVNAVFNNKVSVLVGDFLLATSLKHAGLPKNYHIIDVVATLGKNLADGEILQLANISSPEFSELVYFDVIRKKTAVLFAACTKSAALSVHTKDEQIEILRKFGEYIGICFQIKDDIFDYSDSKEIGKPTGIDMLEGKLTLPVLYVLNNKKDSWAISVATRVKNGTATADEITSLINYTKENGGIEYAEIVMDEYRQKAVDLLNEFPESPVKKSLELYIDFVIDRIK